MQCMRSMRKQSRFRYLAATAVARQFGCHLWSQYNRLLEQLHQPTRIQIDTIPNLPKDTEVWLKALIDNDPGLTGNLLVERLVGEHIDLVSMEEYSQKTLQRVNNQNEVLDLHDLPFSSRQCSTSLPQIPTKMVEEMETKQIFPTKVVKKMNIEGGILEQEIEETDTGRRGPYSDDDDDDNGESPVDDESPIDESGDVLSSSPNRCSWCLRSHKNKPWSSEAVEIFSVFIGQEKSKAVQIYGSIEVLNGLDGSRVFDDCSSLEMKFDIKDVEGCLAIKGYGQHGGFAAIHYSIFEEAVRVTIKVLLNLKTRSFDVNPK
ncbi:hypothetical protein Leryth_025996, partial [Lithospermum erythrorhizon]